MSYSYSKPLADLRVWDTLVFTSHAIERRLIVVHASEIYLGFVTLVYQLLVLCNHRVL